MSFTDRNLVASPRPVRMRRNLEPRQRLKTVGFFAGVGGLELGFERAGHATLLLCELMPEARAVLSAAQELPERRCAFRGARLAVDVRSRTLPSELPDEFDVLTAGFPCQDLSQAGLTRGIEGESSGLIGHVLHLVKRRPKGRRPRWVVLENVSFMRHLAGGRAMEVVLSELSELGYSWAYRELDSLAFGLPQRRRRLFIVACKTGEGDPRSVLLEGDEPSFQGASVPAWQLGRACGFYWTEGNRGIGWADDAVPALKGGSRVGIPSPPAIILPPDGNIILPDIRDAESLQGFPRGWTKPAAAVHSRGDRIRWQLVGNAVSVPVAEWLGERLATHCTELDRSSDAKLARGAKWPRAAWQLDRRAPRFAARLDGWPVALPRKSLLSILYEESKHRAFLSEKATTGFLRRFEASNLLSRSPAHRAALLEALVGHVRKVT